MKILPAKPVRIFRLKNWIYAICKYLPLPTQSRTGALINAQLPHEPARSGELRRKSALAAWRFVAGPFALCVFLVTCAAVSWKIQLEHLLCLCFCSLNPRLLWWPGCTFQIAILPSYFLSRLLSGHGRVVSDRRLWWLRVRGHACVFKACALDVVC